jgi:hypothetical protein
MHEKNERELVASKSEWIGKIVTAGTNISAPTEELFNELFLIGCASHKWN